ncbi:hypothetical protein [Streptomyces sp. NPDC093984]|uniref:hypothetical protein n=1 Tax=Streptomyces sp. NPDC093984 TaxID=3366052 RepID=UPI00382803C6
MAFSSGQDLQYLESLDSVRMPWPGPTGISDSERQRRDDLELQIFVEVLMTLVLGRDVVVPQSYAFDSPGFLTLARTVLQARNRAAIDEHPFRLHLFSADSFEDAAAGMLGRVFDKNRPFFSSLLPELHKPEQYGLDPRDVRWQSENLDRLLNSDWIGVDRAQALNDIRAEFRGLPRVRAKSPAAPLELGKLLASTIEEGSLMGRAAQSLPEPFREVYADLVGAIRRLDPTRSRAFNERSRLRIAEPWPNDSARRTPEEIVGSKDTLDLVIEFVDTLYNAIVADSIGVAPATFSTDVAAGDRILISRAIAQELAIAQYRSGAHQAAWLPHEDVSRGESEEHPLFEVRLNSQAAATESQTRGQLSNLRDSAVDAIAALLDARAQRGGRGRARSPFWKGLDKLAAAEDATAARNALDDHLSCVASILGGRGDAGLVGKFGVQVFLTGGGAAGPAIAAALWQVPGILEFPATAIGAVAPAVAKKGVQSIRRWQGTRRTAHALGRVVDVRGYQP